MSKLWWINMYYALIPEYIFVYSYDIDTMEKKISIYFHCLYFVTLRIDPIDWLVYTFL